MKGPKIKTVCKLKDFQNEGILDYWKLHDYLKNRTHRNKNLMINEIDKIFLEDEKGKKAFYDFLKEEDHVIDFKKGLIIKKHWSKCENYSPKNWNIWTSAIARVVQWEYHNKDKLNKKKINKGD